MSCVSLLLGFIDFIVNPTLNILGDVLESILKALEAANKKPNARRIPEEGSGVSSNNNAASNTNENNNNAAAAAQIMKRPWIDNLTVNRERWQTKHDDGKYPAKILSPFLCTASLEYVSKILFTLATIGCLTNKTKIVLHRETVILYYISGDLISHSLSN